MVNYNLIRGGLNGAKIAVNIQNINIVYSKNYWIKTIVYDSKVVSKAVYYTNSYFSSHAQIEMCIKPKPPFVFMAYLFYL